MFVWTKRSVPASLALAILLRRPESIQSTQQIELIPSGSDDEWTSNFRAKGPKRMARTRHANRRFRQFQIRPLDTPTKKQTPRRPARVNRELTLLNWIMSQN